MAIKLPYDGHKFLTRIAARDIAAGLAADSPPWTEARIGHLVFANFHETDIPAELDLSGRYGAMPLTVPVPRDAPGSLTSDEYVYERSINYRPADEIPKLMPVVMKVRLLDPDTIYSDPWVDDGAADADTTVRKIVEFASFRSYVLVAIDVVVSLTSRPDKRNFPAPILRRMALKLPNVSSLAPSSLNLHIGPDIGQFQHNPKRRTIEWFNMTADKDENGSPTDKKEGNRRFSFPTMWLEINHPGELFTEPSIELEVDAEIQGELLSGMDARLFDALGQQYRRRPDQQLPTLRSTVHHHCTVFLDDTFADRTLTPHQQFHFDEVIPDQLRIADVVTALRDQRFTVTEEPTSGDDHLLRATRWEQASEVVLSVAIAGNHYETARRSVGPGKRRYTTTIPSGNLRLIIRGSVRGECANLIHAVNELQSELRDRFRRLKDVR